MPYLSAIFFLKDFVKSQSWNQAISVWYKCIYFRENTEHWALKIIY